MLLKRPYFPTGATARKPKARVLHSPLNRGGIGGGYNSSTNQGYNWEGIKEGFTIQQSIGKAMGEERVTWTNRASKNTGIPGRGFGRGRDNKD